MIRFEGERASIWGVQYVRFIRVGWMNTTSGAPTGPSAVQRGSTWGKAPPIPLMHRV